MFKLGGYNRVKNAPPGNKRTFKGKRLLCRIDRIYDADTIHITTRLTEKESYYEYPLRVIGIDAPEIHPKQSMPFRELHQEAAINARDQLRALLPVGTVVMVEFDVEDKYGRLLGTVYTLKWKVMRGWKPKINVNQWLIDNGLALAYDGGTKSEFDEEFLTRAIHTNPMGIQKNNPME